MSSDTTSDLVLLLRARGQRVTSQRLVILRELRRRGRHVTAHELADAIHDELPGTSIPTIYATLELLVELDLARKVSFAGPTTLYDARTEPHQHVVCRRCGRVEDLDVPLDCAAALDAARADGFAPDGAELVIAGYCRECVALHGTDAVA